MKGTQLLAVGIIVLLSTTALAQTSQIAARAVLDGQGVPAKMYLDGTAFSNWRGFANSQGYLSISTGQGQHTIYCFYTKGLNYYIGSQSVNVKSDAPTPLTIDLCPASKSHPG